MSNVMANSNGKMVLNRKILGVKIRYARTRAGQTVEEVGEALGIPTEIITNIELGTQDVTLPQLEMMAYLFEIPVIYFWSDEPFQEKKEEFAAQAAMRLRQRIIGVLLRQARLEAGRSQKDLARLLDVSLERIEEYELGRAALPLQQLEILAAYLNEPISYFMDQGIAPNQTGGRIATLEEIAQFSQLPPEIREFLVNPANLLYVNIAMRLSDLSAETLRSLAEGLLEVTY